MVSRTTALNRSSLLGKYRNSVPLETPARAATSSTRVAAKPFSTNRSSAASSSSPGRASLRRSRLALNAADFSQNDLEMGIVTDWLVSNVASYLPGVNPDPQRPQSGPPPATFSQLKSVQKFIREESPRQRGMTRPAASAATRAAPSEKPADRAQRAAIAETHAQPEG